MIFVEMAYLLINCENNQNEKIISELKNIQNVKDVRSVFGAYDLVVKTEGETESHLRDIIQKIRLYSNIRSVLSLPAKA